MIIEIFFIDIIFYKLQIKFSANIQNLLMQKVQISKFGLFIL